MGVKTKTTSWGHYYVVSENQKGYTIKIVIVHPGQILNIRQNIEPQRQLWIALSFVQCLVGSQLNKLILYDIDPNELMVIPKNFFFTIMNKSQKSMVLYQIYADGYYESYSSIQIISKLLDKIPFNFTELLEIKCCKELSQDDSQINLSDPKALARILTKANQIENKIQSTDITSKI